MLRRASGGLCRRGARAMVLSRSRPGAALPRVLFSTTPPPSEKKPKWAYFREPEITPEGVAIIRLDAADAKMNTLNDGLQAEAETLWNEYVVGSSRTVKAAVFTSAKPDNFIAGADIGMLKTRKEAGQEDSLLEACLSGHALFDKLKAQKIPLVAAINGACLGGGLEWALKCDYRVATTSSKTKLGLPEVKLGLLPGWGGTYELPKLIGLTNALPLILQGSEVRADKARKLGLVDATCDVPALETVAVAKALELAEGKSLDKLRRKRAKKSWMRWVTEDVSFARNYVFSQAKKQVDATTRGKYPAADAILECVEFGVTAKTPASAFENEARAFVKLAKTPVSTALIGLFDGITATKKNPYVSAEGVATKKKKTPPTVCVVGAGLMGAGIAQVSAEKGMPVVLKDRDLEGILKGEAYVAGNLEKKVSRKRLTEFEKNATLSRIAAYHDNEALRKGYERRLGGDVDVVIEAVFEKLELKHKVLGEIEKLVSAECVLATNTSAIPIADVAKGIATNPSRVLGMHYFSPVPQMQLLEIIPHAGTSKDALAKAFEVGIKQGKTCIEVKDVPGFYVNRALSPMMAEIKPLFEDGVDPMRLDEAILDLGMPVGPVTLLDEVGADVALHVQTTMVNDVTMGDRMAGADPAMLQAVVDKGWLGRKTGKGFFLYGGKSGKKSSKKKTPNPEALAYVKTHVKLRDLDVPTEDVQDRYLARFVNEAAVCLQDGIIASPRDGDLAAVFGIGFLPFAGGPFRMLDAVGTAAYVDKMLKLKDRYGDRFEPCPLLKDYAKSGKKFYAPASS
mmetsp:Transcript_17427/g.70029  ORF Transcript_17427/g.70029 Transcript_17427/m.70029 type:complete len:795 (+) Transcript_17427:83-2467(+)